jgi:hypothetical protein
MAVATEDTRFRVAGPGFLADFDTFLETDAVFDRVGKSDRSSMVRNLHTHTRVVVVKPSSFLRAMVPPHQTQQVNVSALTLNPYRFVVDVTIPSGILGPVPL